MREVTREEYQELLKTHREVIIEKTPSSWLTEGKIKLFELKEFKYA